MIFSDYTTVASLTYLFLFHVGVLGLVLNRSNVLKTIMSLEILLLSVNLNFILFSTYLDDVVGHVFVIFVLILSAVESSVGLSILSTFYNRRGIIEFDIIKSKNRQIKY